MIEDPQIVEVPARTAAVIHLTVPRERMPEEFPGAVRELLAALGRQGMAPAGPIFAHHLKRPGEIFDFEVGVPVPAPCSGVGRVRPGELPAATVVRTVYHGAYEGLPDAWARFSRDAAERVAAAGFTRGEALREVYVVGPESGPDPTAWRTELSVPLRRAGG